MAYVSGMATSFDDLHTALVNACVANGYTYADTILSKNSLYIKPILFNGLAVQAGTGKTGSSLINPSPRPRLGQLSTNSLGAVNFPCNYYIHILENPDEVYLVINFDIDRYYYLSFGNSMVSGAGAWLSATSPFSYPITALDGFTMTDSTGGDMANSADIVYNASGFFWNTNATGTTADRYANCILLNDNWLYQDVNAIQAAAPLVARSPSAFNQESPLLSVQVCSTAASNKINLLADIAHARYLRIQNYLPKEILIIGSDKWKIYPFHRWFLLCRCIIQ